MYQRRETRKDAGAKKGLGAEAPLASVHCATPEFAGWTRAGSSRRGQGGGVARRIGRNRLCAQQVVKHNVLISHWMMRHCINTPKHIDTDTDTVTDK
jgi:hypothetical protein